MISHTVEKLNEIILTAANNEMQDNMKLDYLSTDLVARIFTF